MAFEHIYRPQHKSDTEIVNDFVVRNALFERLMVDIRKDGPGKLSQHHIVQGLRGMGKSTLFERIRVEMKEPALAERWITVKTAEENWPVNSMLDFWIWIGQHMASVDPAGSAALGDLGSLWNKDDQHEQCFITIEARLKGAKKKVLLLVDNVGELFRKFSKHENHALRELLVSNKHIKLIGGTAVRLDELETHDAPYFDLFKEHHLGGLDRQEVIALLGHYARKNGNQEVERVVKEEPHRVDHLRILTGGVPRTIMLLLDVFNKDGDTSVFDDLRRTLDLVTPLYKHRMDELSPQKQKIVHALAMQWDGMSAGEIGAATRLESKVASSQLGQLVRDGFVLRDETSTKNHFYQLAERFFNIWYLMNNAQRNGSQKVRWLTRFFELWCDEKGLKERAIKHLRTLGRAEPNSIHQLLVTNAFLSSERLDLEIKEQLFEHTRSAFPDHADNLLAEPHWNRRKAETSWLAQALEAYGRKDFMETERLLRNADESNPFTWLLKGKIEIEKGDLVEARRVTNVGHDMCLVLTGDQPDNVGPQRLLSVSHFMLGDLARREGDLNEARAAYEASLSIRTNIAHAEPANMSAQHDVCMTYRRLGDVQLLSGDRGEARKAYEVALRIGKEMVNVHPSQVKANRDLALAHWRLFSSSEVEDPLGEDHLEKYMAIVEEMSKHAVEAWRAGVFEEAISLTNEVVVAPYPTGGVYEALIWGLVRQQYHGMRQLFESRSDQFREKFRPVYFALLRLMKDEDPDSHRRMGKELEEPVRDILARVEAMRKELNGGPKAKPTTTKAKVSRRPKKRVK